MNDEELTPLIHQHAERHAASARLRAAVQTQITLHAVRQQQFTGRLTLFRKIVGWFNLAGARFAGANKVAHLGLSFACGVLLTLALVWVMPHIPITSAAHGGLTGELLSLHIRSMGAGPLFQVASSDRHTVKPWFQGKLDYAPEVADLHNDGFELLGGRIERIQGRDTAVMAYQLRKHIISAYVMPMDHTMPIERQQQKGFNLIHWSDGIMQVWALSDMDASELERFGSAWRSNVSISEINTRRIQQ